MKGNALKRMKYVGIVAMLLMAASVIANFFGLGISVLSIAVGIAAFFILFNRKEIEEGGIDFISAASQLLDRKMWAWILFPAAANFLPLLIACLWLPDFINHVVGRTEQLWISQKTPLLIIQLIIAAVGEEIAWRGFFQKRLGELISIHLSIILTSILFALGHLSRGSALVVAFDLFFVFLNSLLYGIVFKKTNNVWVSAIAHFIANVFAIGIILRIKV